MRYGMKIALSFVASLMLLAAGCQTMDVAGQLGAAVGQATGTITPQQAESITKASSAVGKTFDAITPEQEYFIGRSVAATVLSKYNAYDLKEANWYLNELGQTLAVFSDRPETFGGYHFLIMDTEEINAFSAPGGLVLVSRGLIRCCPNEDALAAVLAHEIGHVEKQHGLRAIKSGRLTSALTILATESAKSFGGQELSQLTEAFEGSISDITSTMMNSGYARNLEFEADKAAVTIMQRAGYNPEGLIVMLEEMNKKLVPGRHDFAATHPTPEARISKVKDILGAQPVPMKEPPVRQQRFTTSAGKI
ncbi:MAG TPA: peptidase M48 [Verrucomicrobia bacterium]|nr:MAG: peptidase M48 [Lentisphaerae bacterium GWF2_57_35]HBA82990.1 peptidase M48 [Verrucomicrobiota bacterium]